MSDSAGFVPGRALAQRLAEALEPRLREVFPNVPVTLALIGPGSDVMGFDTLRSMDHDWGPRVTLLVPEDLTGYVQQRFDEQFVDLVPPDIAGFPTRFSLHPDGTALNDAQGTEHRIRITSMPELLRSTVLVDSIDEMSNAVWLATPMQVLIELTAGEVFVDDSGELTEVRRRLDFYPDHIWRYQLAGLWMRISQVQPFIGRCFETGDRSGAATIALGVVRDMMRIALMQSRLYAPYAKWLGTAFATSAIGQRLAPVLDGDSLHLSDFHTLERSINLAGSGIVQQLNDLALIAEFDPTPFQFWDRPFMVLPAEQIAHALKESVKGYGFERFEATLGGIDIITDSTDALGSHEFRVAVRSMFEAE